MKKIAIACLCLLALAVGGQAVYEGKFAVKIAQWAGLFSDEFFHPNPNTAIDMSNFVVKNEGGRSFLEQRQGFIWAYPPLPGASTSIYGIYISQIASDSERIIVALDDGEFYQIAPNAATPTWYALTSGGGNTSPNCTFTLFKDTIIASGNNKVHIFTRRNGSAGIFEVATYTGVPYQRFFLHQDRIYAYGISTDSTNNKLVWWPEFSLFIQPDSLDAAVVTGRGGFVYVDKNNGGFITNVLPMDNHLICYKSRAIYRLLISPEFNAVSEIIRVVDNTGAYGYDCVNEWNGIHYFLSENGVYSFDGVNAARISDPINYWFSDSITVSTGQAKIFKTQIMDNKLFCSLPVRTSLAVSATVGPGVGAHFVYDLNMQIWYKLNIGNVASANESWFMQRYEYSPACSYPLLGGASAANTKYLGQRMIFVCDSSQANGKDVIGLYPQGWSDGGTDSIQAYWSGAFSPNGNLNQRNQFERFMVYGKHGTLDTLSVYFYSESQSTILDSIKVPLGTSPMLANRRIPATVEGALLRYRIQTYGGAPKINYIEIVGENKGLGVETN